MVKRKSVSLLFCHIVYLVKQKSGSEGLLNALYADLAVTLDAFKCHVN